MSAGFYVHDSCCCSHIICSVCSWCAECCRFVGCKQSSNHLHCKCLTAAQSIDQHGDDMRIAHHAEYPEQNWFTCIPVNETTELVDNGRASTCRLLLQGLAIPDPLRCLYLVLYSQLTSLQRLKACTLQSRSHQTIFSELFLLQLQQFTPAPPWTPRTCISHSTNLSCRGSDLSSGTITQQYCWYAHVKYGVVAKRQVPDELKRHHRRRSCQRSPSSSLSYS